MNISELFPGCESFLEDTQPEPSDAEKHEMALEMMDEYHNVEMDSVNTEKLLSNLDDLSSMFDHVRSFGVDRSFLSLANRDNRLGRYLQLQLPSCESFDVIGNPNSQISIAAMEGLWDGIKRIAAKIRDIIKAIIHWIATKFKQFVNWIKSWFKSSSKKVATVTIWWQDMKTGKYRTVLTKYKNVSTFKSQGKQTFDSVLELSKKFNEALPIIEQEYKNEDPARFLQTSESLLTITNTVAKNVSSDKVTIDLVNNTVTGKDASYDTDTWYRSATTCFKDLPAIEKTLSKAGTVLDGAARWADSWITKIMSSRINHFGNTKPSQVLKEKTAAINKLRNAVTLFMTKILRSIQTSIDTIYKTFEKLSETGKIEGDKNNINKQNKNESIFKSASEESSKK